MPRPTDRTVGSGLVIPERELEIRASRSSGPGGQHVNTSSTRVEVRWNVAASEELTEAQRIRIRAKLGKRIDSEGWLRIVASESRSQHRNREAAIARLHQVVGGALVVPKPRKATKVSAAQKKRRLEDKRRRALIKRERRRTDDGD
jgi:ribosome-associated protein